MNESRSARLEAALADRYRIERQLGEGGMATVYLAEDLRHQRRVAIKVLKPELAAVLGAERFVQEITTTAQLQHPHILPLFDSGAADGFLFYVMPYVQGETLRDKLDREKQLSVEEAVRIGREVADALDYAHRRGVIHRDIKPENILLHDGRPVVADFGIALAVSAAGGGRMTETGLSLGTPYYMSPEQASADRDLSPRSDVYSLGCMLYEMLAGQPPHTGPNAQNVLVRILTEDPRDVTELRRTVPPHVAATAMKAIEKLPADRFESARRFMEALNDEGFTHAPARHTRPAPGTTTLRVPGAPGAQATSNVARWLPWGVAAAALLVAGWSLLPPPPGPPAPTFRMTLSDFVVENAFGGGWRFTISRDGSTIVAGGAGELLYVRRSDDTTFRPIAGTEGALRPSISPDGAWVAFGQDGAIRKVQIAGGPILPVAAAGNFPHWYAQDEILYDEDEATYRVSSAGGQGTLVASNTGARPFMLPGGRAILHDGEEGLYVRILGEEESVLIARGGSNGRYVPTGHVLYGDRQLQSVFAIPFDVDALEVRGQAVPVLPSVNIFSGGAVQLAVSDNGTLVYGLGSGQVGVERRLTWIDMEGNRTQVPGVSLGQNDAQAVRVSPDGTRIAYDAEGRMAVVLDLITGTRTPLVTAGAIRPVWAPDGASLYVRGMTGGFPWQRAAADGSGVLQEWAAEPEGYITSVSADGAWAEVEAGEDIWVVRLGGDSLVARPYLQAAWHEEQGTISPDGRWLAYVSSESGNHQVYLRSFPEPGPATRVSSSGWSDEPMWAPDGSALYFGAWEVSSRGRTLVRRDVRPGNTLELGDETPLFTLGSLVRRHGNRAGDIHPDGKRFIFVTSGEGEQELPDTPGIGPVVVVVNWFQELKARMGEGS